MTNAQALAKGESLESAQRLGSVLADVANRLRPERIGAGSLAEIRRMVPGEFPPAFWRFYFAEIPGPWREPHGAPNEGIDRAWSVLLRSMAEMAPRILDFDVPFGAALANTDYSEARFVRFIRADAEALPRALWEAAHWLAQKGRAVNWQPVAEAVLGGLALPVSPEKARRRMARDYFRAQAARS